MAEFALVKMVRLEDLLRLSLDYEGNELSLLKTCLAKGLTENEICLFSKITVTKICYCLIAAWLNKLA